jgi:hypothetical protein
MAIGWSCSLKFCVSLHVIESNRDSWSITLPSSSQIRFLIWDWRNLKTFLGCSHRQWLVIFFFGGIILIYHSVLALLVCSLNKRSEDTFRLTVFKLCTFVMNPLKICMWLLKVFKDFINICMLLNPACFEFIRIRNFHWLANSADAESG